MESDQQSVQASPPSATGRKPSGPRRRGYGLRNWRVAVRLVALIVVPTSVAALLAGLRVSAAMNSATAYQRVEQLSQLAG